MSAWTIPRAAHRRYHLSRTVTQDQWFTEGPSGVLVYAAPAVPALGLPVEFTAYDREGWPIDATQIPVEAKDLLRGTLPLSPHTGGR